MSRVLSEGIITYFKLIIIVFELVFNKINLITG